MRYWNAPASEDSAVLEIRMKADRLLEEIKSRIEIVEFISDYVPLKKSGQNYKGLCPFHAEKTPSFMVSPTKQIYHCFGCGTGGDIVSFLMRQESLSFGEALNYLAKKLGIRITNHRTDRGETARREKILRMNQEAAQFFMKNLAGSKKAVEYLKNRGISEECIAKFCLGYATAGRDGLFLHLKKRGHADSVLAGKGLVVADERGYRDWFRNRIIFPIMSLKNDVIAFGGRVMDDSLPKYINSPETDVFKKSETLFALNLAKDEIRKKDYVIIVEGYLDAIICHQCGFKNTVAPLGTALTPRQLQKLKVLTKKAVLVFDSDGAGISAARRSLSILCENDFLAKVLLLPEGEDPDSFLRKNGSQAFQGMLSSALSMIQFLLKTSKGDRIDHAREALCMIASVSDILRSAEMLGELADRAKINESVLRSELEKLKKKGRARTDKDRTSFISCAQTEEYLLLSSIISFPEKAGGVLSRLAVEDLRDKTIRSLFHKIKTDAEAFVVNSLLDMADDEEKSLITELLLKPGFDLAHVDRNIDDCLEKIGQRKFEEERREAEERGDIAMLDSLLKQKRRFVKRIQL